MFFLKWIKNLKTATFITIGIIIVLLSRFDLNLSPGNSGKESDNPQQIIDNNMVSFFLTNDTIHHDNTEISMQKFEQIVLKSVQQKEKIVLNHDENVTVEFSEVLKRKLEQMHANYYFLSKQ